MFDSNPGLEVFWNGRLLRDARIKLLPFMDNLGKRSGIPPVCFSRIKGMIFLSSSFKVNVNKVYNKKVVDIYSVY